MKRKQIVLTVVILLIANLLMVPQVASAQTLAAPTQEVPENGATDVPTDTWVSWSDPNFNPNPTYRVQLSRNSSFTDLLVNARLTDGSTGYALRGLPPNTVFYWRVNLSVGSQTSDWSPVWTFQTTNRGVPDAPTLVSPTNGATGVLRSPTLVWNAVEGADLYWVKVGCLEFVLVHGTSITISEEDLSLCYSDHHFWSVQARNPAGLSNSSETWEVTRTP